MCKLAFLSCKPSHSLLCERSKTLKAKCKQHFQVKVLIRTGLADTLIIDSFQFHIHYVCIHMSSVSNLSLTHRQKCPWKQLIWKQQNTNLSTKPFSIKRNSDFLRFFSYPKLELSNFQVRLCLYLSSTQSPIFFSPSFVRSSWVQPILSHLSFQSWKATAKPHLSARELLSLRHLLPSSLQIIHPSAVPASSSCILNLGCNVFWLKPKQLKKISMLPCLIQIRDKHASWYNTDK